MPLAGKLVGANAIIVLAATGATLAARAGGAGDGRVLLVLGLALGGSLIVNVTLVVIALRPLGDLEATAARIWQGDFDARVPTSLLADAHVARIGRTLNVLLDGLTSDRARMRRLAAEVISAGDRERAHIARELHDSAAQSLAALVYQLSAAEREVANGECDDADMAERLGGIKELATSVLEEVRLLAHTVHPRVLDDLGLPAALRRLGREVEASTRARVNIVAGDEARAVPPTLASVFYRIAQEAINNAVRHAAPTDVDVRLVIGATHATLEVTDNGRGFDVEEAERRRPGMGLFTMHERVSLVNGAFAIDSKPGRGTKVLVTLPLDQRGAA
jgi:signal transduction histidine kinase